MTDIEPRGFINNFPLQFLQDEYTTDLDEHTAKFKGVAKRKIDNGTCIIPNIYCRKVKPKHLQLLLVVFDRSEIFFHQEMPHQLHLYHP